MTAILVLIIIILIVLNILAWLSLSESGRHIKLLRNALAIYGRHHIDCQTLEPCFKMEHVKECNCGWEGIQEL